MEEFILEAGHCMDIPVGVVPQMEALEDTELYEFSSQHFTVIHIAWYAAIKARRQHIR